MRHLVIILTLATLATSCCKDEGYRMVARTPHWSVYEVNDTTLLGVSSNDNVKPVLYRVKDADEVPPTLENNDAS